jgi:hypothetical protein
LPFELLPLFDGTWPTSIRTREDVEVAAASFPGFAAVVRRLPATTLSQATFFDPQPLNVGFVRYYSMDGAKRE